MRIRATRLALGLGLAGLGLMAWVGVAGAVTVAAAATATAADAVMPAASAPSVAGLAPQRVARLDTFLRAATADGGYLGAVALVAHHGQVVHWQAYGQRDLARHEPMARDAIFRIYSMTKPLVSVAVLMLLEEGRLTLDDPIALHLPAFAGLRVFASGTADAPVLRDAARVSTVRHLLTHTTGFATGGPSMAQATALLERAGLPQSADLADFAQRVATVPLGADPGTRFGYDGVNTEVLSRIVEVASGMPLATFLRQRIFVPLGMRDTGFDVPGAQRARIADISMRGDGGTLVLAPGPSAAEPGVPLNRYSSGAGGLYSTAPDYLRLCQMLLNGGQLDGVRLLGRKSVELMTGNQLAHLETAAGNVPGLSAGEGYGLGVSVITDLARRGRLGSVGAFGWSGAASTYFSIDPKEQLVAILLMQHLPRDDQPGQLPKLSVKFYNLVYQALDP